MQSALVHAAAAAPAQAQCGRPAPRRPARLGARVACQAVQTAAAPEAATGAVKLPATHLASSAAALQQLKASSVNRYAMEKKSSIIAIGLTVHNAPVELREKLAVPEAEWQRAIEELCSYPHIEEAAVLSTCNRMEIYVVAVSFHRGVREVEDWMSRASGVGLEELRPHLFLLRDRDATGHLLRVSGGLDSLVMGEGQILAQVKQVHKVGQNAPGFGRHLNGLFKQAVTAGKRVRSETSISSGAVSVSSAAAELAQLKLPTHDFNDAKVCIIGAGKMSKLLVKHMHSKGCTRMTVLNRSLPRAEALAEEFPEVQFDIHLMHDLMKCVEESDLIFAASGSEELLVHKEDIENMPAASEKVGGVRRFVDISVPRNIAPQLNELEGKAIVYNVDDLKEVVAANKEERARAAAEAEVLLKEEQLAFEAWRDSLETVPTIKALRGKAETIRASELEKTLNKLGDGLTNKQKKVRAGVGWDRVVPRCITAAAAAGQVRLQFARKLAVATAQPTPPGMIASPLPPPLLAFPTPQVIEELSKGIVNKLLHGPMTALRCDGADADTVAQTLANMEALERMFGLSEDEGLTPAQAQKVKAAAGKR
jgi:glutamyl-tRNA reductase